MDDPPEDDNIGNWSYVTSSLQSSLLREETDSYERIENEAIDVNLVDNNYEEDIWHSAHSSLEHLEKESTSCDRCEEDAAARTRLELELDEIKREMERVYKISVHIKIRYEVLKMNAKEAKEWIEGIGKELDNERYECITENTVKKIIGIMKKFENNKYIVENGIDILEIMTCCSGRTVHYITNNPRDIVYLMKLFKHGYPIWYHFCILFRIAACKETQKKLMKSEGLFPIFQRLSNEQDPTYVLFSSIILSHLLDFSEDSFPVNLTKNMIESKIIERLSKLSTDYIPCVMLLNDFSWYLERLTNGTKAQKYLCAIVVYSAMCYSDFTKQLKDAGAIPILESVLSDENTDSFVKGLVDKGLQYLKK